MNRYSALRYAVLACLLLSMFTALPGQRYFKVHLSGQNEVHPVATMANGELFGVLDGMKLVLWGSFENLTDELASEVNGGMHIHLGFAGENGPALVPIRARLTPDRRTGIIESADNFLPLTMVQMDALLKRRLYVNVHSKAYPEGELRGQILPLSDEYFHANIFGSQEVPAVMTNGSGAIDLEIRGDELVVTGSFQALEGAFDPTVGGGVHLHSGRPGENGPAIIRLDPNVLPGGKRGYFLAARNTFTLQPGQLEAIRERGYYINIHTDLHQAGEIRGQVVGQARLVVRAHLSGANSVPAVHSPGSGVVFAELSNDFDLVVYGSFSGLGSDLFIGTHIHQGSAGETGMVEFQLAPEVNPDNRSGRFRLADNQLIANSFQQVALVNRRMYVNIHTTDNPDGELRGQFLPEGAMYFTGLLTGSQQQPAIFSRGYGAVKGELSGNRLVISGFFSGLDSPVDLNFGGGSHLHFGLPGQTGGVAFRVVPSLASGNRIGRFNALNNTLTLTDGQVAQLRKRGLYLNIHTLDHPSGELRGQLLFEANNYYFAVLSGESEVPAVNSPGSGLVALEQTLERAVVCGSFRGLGSALDPVVGSHLHNALAGRTGPIRSTLVVEDDPGGRSGHFAAESNTLFLDTDDRSSLFDRQIYINLHSRDQPGGELRGQLLPPAQAYFSAYLSGQTVLPPTEATSLGSVKVEWSVDRTVLTGSFNELEDDYFTIDPGAFIYLGGPAENGPIQTVLDPIVDPNLRGGVFSADRNTFRPGMVQEMALAEGNWYIGVHSAAYPNGEIRGQLLPEVNYFPTDEAQILTPVNGSSLFLLGPPATPLKINWTEARDENRMVYQWELATDPDFNDRLVSGTFSPSTSYNTTYGDLDFILESRGLDVGQSLNLYHRAVCSDGSLLTPGSAALVQVTRQGLDAPRTRIGAPFGSVGGSRLEIYPNPVQGLARARLDAELQGLVSYQLLDLSGKVWLDGKATVYKGLNQLDLNLEGVPAGSYFLQVEFPGGGSSTARVQRSR